MKNLISLIMIALMLFLAPVHAYAQTTHLPDVTAPPDEEDVGEAISPMNRGQKAPFTGLLLSPNAVAKIMADLKSIDERLKIERENERRVCEAQESFKAREVMITLESDKKIIQAELNASRKENTVLVERIGKIEEEKPDVMLWTLGGAAGGVVATLLIVLANSYAQGSR